MTDFEPIRFQAPNEQGGMSRRSFLTNLAYASGTLLLGKEFLAPSDIGMAPAIKQSPVKTLKPVCHPPLKTTCAPAEPVRRARPRPRPSYGNTAITSAIATGINYSTAIGLNAAGIKVGNSAVMPDLNNPARIEEELDKVAAMSATKIASVISSTVVGAPAAEEAAFRLIPSLGANLFNVPGNAWGWGFFSSVAFASMHGFENDSGDLVIPAPQFLGGMFNWWMQRNRGYSHAALAHMIHNAPAVPISIAGAIYAKQYKAAQLQQPKPGISLEDFGKALREYTDQIKEQRARDEH